MTRIGVAICLIAEACRSAAPLPIVDAAPNETSTGITTDTSATDLETAPGVGDWIDVDVGFVYSCGIHYNGEIECWGVPSVITQNPPSGVGYQDIAIGNEWSCALSDTGKMKCWCNFGYESHCEQMAGTFESIVANTLETCAVSVTGEAQCWPKPALAPPPIDSIFPGTRAHCALEYPGAEPYCWDSTPQIPQPSQLLPPSGVAFIDLALSAFGGCGVEPSGEVLCWGDSVLGSAYPSRPFKGEFVRVDAESFHACALDTQGGVQCVAPTSPTVWEGDLNPPPGIIFTKIATGAFHNCGLTVDSGIVCWGSDEYGMNTPPGPLP